jgi:hypothetical protein
MRRAKGYSAFTALTIDNKMMQQQQANELVRSQQVTV